MRAGFACDLYHEGPLLCDDGDEEHVLPRIRVVVLTIEILT